MRRICLVLQLTVWKGCLERGDAPFAEHIICYLIKLDSLCNLKWYKIYIREIHLVQLKKQGKIFNRIFMFQLATASQEGNFHGFHSMHVWAKA